jgi:hypothetical protein
VCFGLRVSECFRLKWFDVDWLGAKLSIRRAIVRHRVGDPKTAYSNRPLAIDAEMLGVLRRWKQATQFSANEDWMLASPTQLGRLPWSADAVTDVYRKPVITHSMRHTHRSRLSAVGTRIQAPEKLMRHADIRTTMNTHGDVVTDEMSVAGKNHSFGSQWQVTCPFSAAKALVLAEASGSRTHRRRGDPPPAGFEDRGSHRTTCASVIFNIYSVQRARLPPTSGWKIFSRDKSSGPEIRTAVRWC